MDSIFTIIIELLLTACRKIANKKELPYCDLFHLIIMCIKYFDIPIKMSKNAVYFIVSE